MALTRTGTLCVAIQELRSSASNKTREPIRKKGMVRLAVMRRNVGRLSPRFLQASRAESNLSIRHAYATGFPLPPTWCPSSALGSSVRRLSGSTSLESRSPSDGSLRHTACLTVLVLSADAHVRSHMLRYELTTKLSHHPHRNQGRPTGIVSSLGLSRSSSRCLAFSKSMGFACEYSSVISAFLCPVSPRST